MTHDENHALDLLERAYDCARSGRETEAQALYDQVAMIRPTRQMRAYWPLALTKPGTLGEEWATAALKRADVHITYGEFPEAAAFLGLATAPEHKAAVVVGHARVALAAHRAGDALALTEQARRLAPQSSYAAVIHGAALLAADRSKDAIEPLTFAAAQGRAGAHFILGLAWQRLQEPAKSIAAYREAYAFDPEDFGPANNLMPALMEARDYRGAAAHADSLLARRPSHTTSLAYKYIALGELGETQALAHLADYGLLLKSEQLGVPAGYASRAAFHRALTTEISADPSLAYQRNTTRFGHQTDDIGFSNAPAVKALNALLTAAVQRRAATARTSPTHPFDQGVPRDFRLYSWGVIMGEKGHQAPHIHPHGWLSGVYYIDVPEEITADDPARNGWIEFGRGDARWNQPTTSMPIHQVRPEVGTLLTFPSYFWHSTRPLKPNKPRISFAFDVIPL